MPTADGADGAGTTPRSIIVTRLRLRLPTRPAAANRLAWVYDTVSCSTSRQGPGEEEQVVVYQRMSSREGRLRLTRGLINPQPLPHLTPARWLLASLIGVGVAVAGLIPPTFHICTGPLGPLIGGYIAGRWSAARPRGALLIGLGMGALFALPPLLLHLAIARRWLTLPPDIAGSLDLFTLLAVPYVGLLGALGANRGGAAARHDHATALAAWQAALARNSDP